MLKFPYGNSDELAQLRRYRDVLVAKYQEPERLRCLAVVAIGFERVVWEELG